MKNIKSTIKKFFDEHPKLRKFIDVIDVYTNKLFIAYLVLCSAVILFPTMLFYFLLDDSIKKDIITLVGGVLSVILIPLILKFLNKRHTLEYKLLDINQDLFFELSEVLINTLLFYCKDKNKAVSYFENFITENYSSMLMSFPKSLLEKISVFYYEIKHDSYDNAKYYAEKCILHIRRQYGLENNFYFKPLLFNLYMNSKTINDVKHNKITN